MLALYSSFNFISWRIRINLFSSWVSDMKLRFMFDWMSLSFIRVVLLISTVIIIYSYNYMAPYNKSSYFLWLTVLFVLSMLLVITMSNLFFAMLGWDGLGLVSFFLIVYYQNQSSIVSGVFTLLINRLGDTFFIVRLVLLFYSYPDFFSFSSDIPSLLLVGILVLTFITKRAIYPFSPWLPLAIAAPTPISALVHSSTLVTSGLYLMIRFSYLIYSKPEVINLLLLLAVFTSFYAGLNTIFEVDLKKLIALSTLRHLGFIGIAFSVGLLHLRFFHLLVHALFKSLLFITIGDIITNINHSQDIRYLSKGSVYTPFSSLLINVSIINLLGIPNMRGYFSKDLVLESINYNNMSVFVVVIIYMNVLFTYYYSYKLFYFTFQSIKLNPYQIFHTPFFIHAFLMSFLALSTLLFTYIFINYVYLSVTFYSVPLTVKFLPLLLNILVFTYLVKYLCLPTLKYKAPTAFFSSMMFLRNITIRLAPKFYYSVLFYFVKTMEPRFLRYSIHYKPFLLFQSSVPHFVYKSLFNIQFNIFIFSFIFILMFILCFNI